MCLNNTFFCIFTVQLHMKTRPFRLSCKLIFLSQKTVGSIAICGTQKTVIYTYGEHPAGKTHPIGASGAITSDLIGPNRNEYMCCFMAKEKRLLVFELRQKSIVVSSNRSSIC